jgi:glycyl-tRNA synthetase
MNIGVDCAILMNPKTWEASGHIGGFSDPLMDCRDCKARYRADELIDKFIEKKALNINTHGWSNEQMEDFIKQNGINCPNCGKADFTSIRKFNLMFKTYQGVNEDTASVVYLRPETAQGIFVNFKNVLRTTRKRLPLGIGQIGKSFRNEITPGNFIFRTREFEQMELEFFCEPGTELEWFNYWKNFCKDWLLSLGFREENIKLRDHDPEELSHYSNATTDFEFKFPFGWGELWGIASRTDFDLKAHQNTSGESMEYTDPVTNKKFIPYCIEPSLGADRMLLAVLVNAYYEDTVDGESRTVLRLHPALAPYKVAVLPLQKKLEDKAGEIYLELSKYFSATYDVTGSIGKRYRRQDEAGTPYCVTIDFDTLENGSVTVRERDSMSQIRIKISELKDYLEEKTAY